VNSITTCGCIIEDAENSYLHFMQKVDNVPMLQLDIVWCYFMLRHVSCLEVAGDRLKKARLGFERSHGKDSTRFRLLQAGRQADLAM
jgi:hypothetical protein